MWVRIDSKKSTAVVGLTEERAEGLPEILSIDMPMVDDELEMDMDCMHFHLDTGIKIALSPLTGRVLEINRDVLDNPDLLHLKPYVNWLFKMELDDLEELETLMTAKEYGRYLDQIEYGS
jgi:glycine cleavage system H protein